MYKDIFVCFWSALLVVNVSCTFESRQAVNEVKLEAEQGFMAAQFNLGVMYASGRGVPKDYVKAVKWYKKAAEQGLVNAQFNLGASYANGEGVPQSNVFAYMWWLLAKAQGNEKASKYIVVLEQEMTLDDISEAQHLANNWWGENKK